MPEIAQQAPDGQAAHNTLSEAARLLGEGRFDAAAPLLDGLLAAHPDEAQALHMRGIVALQAGDNALARALLERAAKHRRDDPQLLNNLANAERATGDVAAAEATLTTLIAIAPGYAGAHYNLADIRRERGETDAAIAGFREAIAHDAGLIQAHVELARTLLDAGDTAAAVEAAQHATAAAPDLALAQGILGAALLEAGEAAQAVRPCRRAVALDTKTPWYRLTLGVALSRTGDLAGAEAMYEGVLTAEPENALASANLGHVLNQRNAAEEALAHCRHATTLAPELALGWTNLSATLMTLGDATEALAAADRALALEPEDPDALNNQALALDTMGRGAEARAAFSRAIALEPDHAEAHFGRALSLLADGDYAAGFAEYEWRLQLDSKAVSRVPLPRWDGTPLGDKRILVHAEQGFGDTLQFVRFLPEVAARGGSIVLACQAPLVSLLETMDCVGQAAPMEEPPPACDVQVPLASLPHLLGTTLETLPAATPYIPAPDPWELAPPVGTRLKVGLVWSGGTDNRINRRRSLPLNALAPVLRAGGITCYSLQVGPEAEEAATNIDIEDLAPRLGTFADTAAAIGGLDLVISIDTAVAHLAGALGVPLWVMLSHGGDWRYGRNGPACPWYPHMRLYRQPVPGDWGSVVETILDDLDHATTR